jgi:hypothetical protein
MGLDIVWPEHRNNYIWWWNPYRINFLKINTSVLHSLSTLDSNSFFTKFLFFTCTEYVSAKWVVGIPYCVWAWAGVFFQYLKFIHLKFSHFKLIFHECEISMMSLWHVSINLNLCICICIYTYFKNKKKVYNLT